MNDMFGNFNTNKIIAIYNYILHIETLLINERYHTFFVVDFN